MLFPPETHAANAPETWRVARMGRTWRLMTADGHVLRSFSTKREAEAATRSGFYFELYHKEDRWYRGESVPGWKPFRPWYEIVVRGAVMGRGPGHLSEQQAAEWVEIYRKINPDLPADAVYTRTGLC